MAHKSCKRAVRYVLHVLRFCVAVLLEGCFIGDARGAVDCLPKCLKRFNMLRIESHKWIKLFAVHPGTLHHGSLAEAVFNIPLLIFGVICVANLNTN